MHPRTHTSDFLSNRKKEKLFQNHSYYYKITTFNNNIVTIYCDASEINYMVYLNNYNNDCSGTCAGTKMSK